MNCAPVRFRDPTGHAKYGGDDYDPADEPWTPYRTRKSPSWVSPLETAAKPDAKERRQLIHDYAQRQLDEGASSVDAWASTAGYAARLSEGDPDVFMRDVSRVFTGFTQKLAPLHWATQTVVGDSPYKVPFKSDGFNGMLADPDITNDQVRHCWFYTQIAYTWGGGIASFGNIWHEWGPGQMGQSEQDLWAGFYAAYLGYLLDEGLISVYEVEDWIRENFGEEAEQQEP